MLLNSYEQALLQHIARAPANANKDQLINDFYHGITPDTRHEYELPTARPQDKPAISPYRTR